MGEAEKHQELSLEQREALRIAAYAFLLSSSEVIDDTNRKRPDAISYSFKFKLDDERAAQVEMAWPIDPVRGLGILRPGSRK
jgi:hypothetical protein